MVDTMDRFGKTQKSLIEALNLDPQECHRISVVGGGGKTTLIQALAEEFLKFLPDVIITPTTKIYPPEYGEIILEESIKKLESFHGILTVGIPWKNGKLAGVSNEFLQEIFLRYPVVLMEADGAKGFPSKAPREGEPVIPKETTTVIAVQGIDACERKIKEGCFRTDRVCALLNKKEEEQLLPEDMAELYLNPKGLRKGVEKQNFWAIIQKVETKVQKEKAMEIVEKLKNRSFHQVLLTYKK